MAQWVKSLLQNHEDLTPVTLVLGGVEVETCRSPDAGKPEGSTGELWVQTEEVTWSLPLPSQAQVLKQVCCLRAAL